MTTSDSIESRRGVFSTNGQSWRYQEHKDKDKNGETAPRINDLGGCGQMHG